MVVGAVLALVGGVTYAQLTSTATLSSTSINTASAGLQIFDGTAFAPTAPGFAITNLVPGTGTVENVYFQNNGGVTLGITANVPTQPTSSGFTGWNNATVKITAEDTSCTQAPGWVANTANSDQANSSPFTVDTDLQDLMAGNVVLPCAMNAGAQGNNAVPGTSGNYDFKFDIHPASITGTSATIGVFDINFTGNQVVPTT